MSHENRSVRNACVIARELDQDHVRPKRRKLLGIVLGGLDKKHDNSKPRCKQHRRK